MAQVDLLVLNLNLQVIEQPKSGPIRLDDVAVLRLATTEGLRMQLYDLSHREDQVNGSKN